MDTAYISALAALAGSAIGGATSVASSWLTQQSQAKFQRLNNERDRRENLFGRFIDEASKLYTDAMQNERDDPSQLLGIYALLNRIRLVSSLPVIDSADRVTEVIVEAYLAPNMTLHEVQARLKKADHVDPLREFAEACREELRQFGLP
jgi:hypothetical protein